MFQPGSSKNIISLKFAFDTSNIDQFMRRNLCIYQPVGGKQDPEVFGIPQANHDECFLLLVDALLVRLEI